MGNKEGEKTYLKSGRGRILDNFKENKKVLCRFIEDEDGKLVSSREAMKGRCRE